MRQRAFLRSFLLSPVFCLLTSALHAQTTTPNFGLTEPAIGAGNWGTTLNTDLSILDSVIFGVPFASDALMHVSGNGNDSNNGFSWRTAKLTVQGALNALPANGGIVKIACGASLSFSSTIVAPNLNSNNYEILGDCAPMKTDNSSGPNYMPTLTYTGTGMAIQNGGFSLLANFNLVGPGRAGTTVGIDCNGPLTDFERLRVGGFGTGWQEDNNCFLTMWLGGSIHDNGTNIGSVASPTNAGENINFMNALISDTAVNMNQTCVNLTAFGGGDFGFTNVSIDGCGITINSPGRYPFVGSHFEALNPGTHVFQFQILHNYVQLGLFGTSFRQDNGSSNSSYFIQQGANLGNSITAYGNTFTAAAGVSMTAVFNCVTGDPAAILNVAGAQVSGTFTGTTVPSGSGLITASDLSGCGPYNDIDGGTFINQSLTVGTGASPNNFSVNSAGVVQVLGHLLSSPTAPTISSGFGALPSIVQQNGTAAFEVNVGTGGTATNGVIGMPAAANGWSCQITDMSTNIVTRETAFTTTTVTLTASTAWTASDKLLVTCGGF